MSHPEKETVYHPMMPDGDPEPMEYVRADIVEQLRELCREQHEALVGAKEMIDVAHPQFNWGASALAANGIALLNSVPSKVEKAIAKYEAMQK